MPPENSTRVMYIAPSSGHISLNFNMPFKLILRRFKVVFYVWSENAALFERLMETHSNPPILYYGFNINFYTVIDIHIHSVNFTVWPMAMAGPNCNGDRGHP